MNKPDTGNIPYLPHTERDRDAMLSAIGVKSFDDLVDQIPAHLRSGALEILDGLSELELTQHVSNLAAKNVPASKQACFIGGGSYSRFVPSVVPQMISRSEFATAYTPYQPEVSQGSLQAIYEFQSAISLLTGMDVANASMYDGPTACAEAGLMAARVTKRKKLVVLESVGPESRMVTHTYATACGLSWETIPCPHGIADGSEITLDNETAAIIVQYPNFFGCLEDLEMIKQKATEAGALLIVVTEPISLALLTPPGEFGADIVVGDAQPCGNSLSFGGPSAGYMSCRGEFMRQIPGRLAGITVDKQGKRAFTLTLQTREQHIRRERATSNICTNQALNALAMLVYLTMVGKQGLVKLARVSVERAHYLAEQLVAIDGVSLAYDAPFFNEFLLKLSSPVSPDALLNKMRESNILAGLNITPMYSHLKDCLLVAVTERNSKNEIDKYVETFSKSIQELASKEAREAVRSAKS